MRWRVALGTLVLQFTYGLVFSWGAAAPDVRAHEHWPDPLIGAVFSATPLGYGIATVLGGRLADRLPPRPLCAVGVLLLLAGFAVAFLWPSPLTFVAGYAFLALGLGGGLALTGSVGAAIQAFPERAGSAGGALTAMYALGAVVQVPTVAALVAALGWLNALRLVGTALAVLAVLAVLLLPSLPAPPQSAEEHVPALALLRRWRVWTGILLAATATPLGAYAFVNVGRLAAAALVAVAVGNAAGRVSVGVLADAIGADRVLIAIALIELASGFLVATSPSRLVLAGALGAGLALGGGAGALTRMAADASPDAPHSTFGFLFAGFAAGALAGPLLGPLLGSGAAPWIGLALLALPGMALLGLRVYSPGVPRGE